MPYFASRAFELLPVGISVPLPFSRWIQEGNVPLAYLDKKNFLLASREYLKRVCLHFPKTVEHGCLDAYRYMKFFALLSELAGLLAQTWSSPIRAVGCSASLDHDQKNRQICTRCMGPLGTCTVPISLRTSLLSKSPALVFVMYL